MHRIITKSSLVGLMLLLGACTHYHHYPDWDHDNRYKNNPQKYYHHDNSYKKHKHNHDD